MVLLQLGDVEALQTLEKDEDALVGLLPGRETILEVSASLGTYYRNPDTQGIAILGQLASNTEAGHLSSASTPIGHISIAQSAAHCLRSIHSADTLPILYRLLSSPDRAIRYDAVFGLDSFAQNLPVQDYTNVVNLHYLRSLPNGRYNTAEIRGFGPSIGAFNNDEEKYLAFWTNWYQKNFLSATP